MSQLEEFRTAIDEFMGQHPQSPLDPQQQSQFQGLRYFPENKEMVLTVDVEPYPDTEPLVEMETSTGDVQAYRRWGRFKFAADGQEAALTIYSDQHGHEFFMPFKDATNGKETYGAGRYLDNHRPGLQQLTATRFEVDFNFAYNPYCAYSVAYSCPLPPHENWLRVPIRAGEKNFE